MTGSLFRIFDPVALPGLLSPVLADTAIQNSTEQEPAGWYQFATPSRDGIGKYYRGRKISHVMGHRGAGWLETRDTLPQQHLMLLKKPAQ